MVSIFVLYMFKIKTRSWLFTFLVICDKILVKKIELDKLEFGELNMVAID